MNSGGKTNERPRKQTHAKHTMHRLKGEKPIRLVCPPQIDAIKHRLVFDAFQVLFEQFPRKIAELKSMMTQDRYRLERKDIFTDLAAFGVPPSLRELQNEHKLNRRAENQNEIICNCNRQTQVYLNYDGYVKANMHLVQFVCQLEPFYDFYTNWWNQFYYALNLMKPQMQEENNLDSAIQESTIAFLADICNKITGFIDSVDICQDRFGIVLKIQQFPHIDDYRQDLIIFERQTWFELNLILQTLHSSFVLTYDCVVKNYQKLI